MPVTVNAAEIRVFFTPAATAALKAAVPDFERATGHAVNLEEPALFNRITAEFLAQVDSGRWKPRDVRSLGKSTMAGKK